MEVAVYMLLSREERTSHIDLNAPCNCWEGASSYGKRRARKSLFRFLGLQGTHTRRTECCHLCPNDSKSGTVCMNPLHLYLGTPFENHMDIPEAVRQNSYSRRGQVGGKSRTPEGMSRAGQVGGKIGGRVLVEQRKGLFDPRNREKVIEGCREGGRKGCATINAVRWRCLETGHISNSGGLSRYQKARGIDTRLREVVEEAAPTNNQSTHKSRDQWTPDLLP